MIKLAGNSAQLDGGMGVAAYPGEQQPWWAAVQQSAAAVRLRRPLSAALGRQGDRPMTAVNCTRRETL
jgi:hypothetical protein